jgi:branched-chain amino acid aminotransferase
MTPALTTGCLAGVTRGLVVEWSGAAEVEMPEGALDQASEVFVTSSTRDVQPVARVDDRRYPSPGPVTAGVAALFARRSSTELDP